MKRRTRMIALAAALATLAVAATGLAPIKRDAQHAIAIDAGELDHAAIRTDDTLLDVLGSAFPGGAGSLVDDELTSLLLGWRVEVEHTPMPGWCS